MIRRRRIRLYDKEWRDIWKLMIRGKLVEGENVRLFEREFALYIGKKFAVATCSGRDGMELLFDAMGLCKGDEVIMPAYTLKDLVLLMERKGIHPVLVDVERDTFNIDPARIEAKLTSRTRAILATHIFGVPCDIEEITRIARDHGVKVIEDCAHAAGAEYRGRKLGSFGDAAFFSFEMTKPVNAFGGGMVVTDDGEIAEFIRSKVDQYPGTSGGILKKMLFLYLEHLIIRSPLFPLLIRIFTSNIRIAGRLYRALHSGTRLERFRYSNVQALIGLKQMRCLDMNNSRRSEAGRKLTGTLKTNNAFPQRVPEGGKRVFYFYVARLDTDKSPELVRREMIAHGIDVGIKDEITDNCSLLRGNEDEFPVASELYEKNLQLPMYDDLRGEEIARISRALDEVCSTQVVGSRE